MAQAKKKRTVWDGDLIPSTVMEIEHRLSGLKTDHVATTGSTYGFDEKSALRTIIKTMRTKMEQRKRRAAEIREIWEEFNEKPVQESQKTPSGEKNSGWGEPAAALWIPKGYAVAEQEFEFNDDDTVTGTITLRRRSP